MNQAVVVKDDDKPKYKEVHFKDRVNSMIMDIEMPPHYHFRQGNTNMYNFDLNKIVRQLNSTASDEILPRDLLTMKIQQKNNPKQNYNQIVNLATFFSSGRDTVDYGYSLDSVGKQTAEEEFNSLSRLDKGDIMNVDFMNTEITSDAKSTGAHKIPIDEESNETYKFSIHTDTENTEFSSTTASWDPDVSIHLEPNLH